MTKDEFKYLIKTYLRLKIEHDEKQDRVKVILLFEDDPIDHDYIDYTEVVRVVDRLNRGEYQ